MRVSLVMERIGLNLFSCVCMDNLGSVLLLIIFLVCFCMSLMLLMLCKVAMCPLAGELPKEINLLTRTVNMYIFFVKCR